MPLKSKTIFGAFLIAVLWTFSAVDVKAESETLCAKIVGLSYERPCCDGAPYATFQTSSATDTLPVFDRDEGDHGLVEMLTAAYVTAETVKVTVDDLIDGKITGVVLGNTECPPDSSGGTTGGTTGDGTTGGDGDGDSGGGCSLVRR